MQPPSIQQVQSMATTVAKLTRQNQELTKEITLGRQHHERYVEGQAQSQEEWCLDKLSFLFFFLIKFG